MRKSDLRVLLAEQSSVPVEAVALPVVARGTEAVRDALKRLAPPVAHVVADAVTDADLDTWAPVALEQPLSSGSAGLAAALARTHAATSAPADPVRLPEGPIGFLSGSCSVATQGQVRHLLGRQGGLFIDVRALASGAQGVADVERHLDEAAAAGEPPFVYSTTAADELAAVQAELGVERAAHLVEELMGQAARAMVARGVRRVVVAGGETSGAVVDALGPTGIWIGPEVAPGVPWTITTDADPIALLLKSGNFGSEDFFSVARSWR
jgi:uncharacterized protein YgbK (DUF1537 family)